MNRLVTLWQGIGTLAAKVTTAATAVLKATDGPSASWILITDETNLYVIQHGTVVLLVPTPDTITAVCVHVLLLAN